MLRISEKRSPGWVCWVAGLLILAGPWALTGCGGGDVKATLTLAEIDRAVQCYSCQQPCFRRVNEWGDSEKRYFTCLKRCADRHDVDQEICAVAHPETFTGISRVGPKKKKEKKEKKNFGRLKGK